MTNRISLEEAAARIEYLTIHASTSLNSALADDQHAKQSQPDLIPMRTVNELREQSRMAKELAYFLEQPGQHFLTASDRAVQALRTSLNGAHNQGARS